MYDDVAITVDGEPISVDWLYVRVQPLRPQVLSCRTHAPTEGTRLQLQLYKVIGANTYVAETSYLLLTSGTALIALETPWAMS